MGAKMAGGAHLETPEGRLTRLAADGGGRDNEPPRLKPDRWTDNTRTLKMSRLIVLLGFYLPGVLWICKKKRPSSC